MFVHELTRAGTNNADADFHLFIPVPWFVAGRWKIIHKCQQSTFDL